MGMLQNMSIDSLIPSYGEALQALIGGLNINNSSPLDQQVTITAEFPNVVSHSEIEQAFENIINMASQYANRK